LIVTIDRLDGPFLDFDAIAKGYASCAVASPLADDVQRPYCTHCAWFHESVDETRHDMLRHIQTALGEVQAALEMAKSLADETHRSDQLTVAHRELRRALSARDGPSASASVLR
jgi:hypothetical protein